MSPHVFFFSFFKSTVCTVNVLNMCLFSGEKKEGPEVKPEAMEVEEGGEGSQKLKEEPAEMATPELETKETAKEETPSTPGIMQYL